MHTYIHAAVEAAICDSEKFDFLLEKRTLVPKTFIPLEKEGGI